MQRQGKGTKYNISSTRIFTATLQTRFVFTEELSFVTKRDVPPDTHRFSKFIRLHSMARSGHHQIFQRAQGDNPALVPRYIRPPVAAHPRTDRLAMPVDLRMTDTRQLIAAKASGGTHRSHPSLQPICRWGSPSALVPCVTTGT